MIRQFTEKIERHAEALKSLIDEEIKTRKENEISILEWLAAKPWRFPCFLAVLLLMLRRLLLELSFSPLRRTTLQEAYLQSSYSCL